ncbi:MAG: hypothetical protein Q4E05_10045, partial [Pseudoclavibacter sp.]|nr:hypothetical protein [Pseudoclavibacter sp.]
TASIATIKRPQTPSAGPAPAAARAEEDRRRGDRATFAPLGLREDAAPEEPEGQLAPEAGTETPVPETPVPEDGQGPARPGEIDLETAAAALGLPADSTAEEVLAAAEAAEQAEIEAAATGMLPVAGPADAQLPIVLDPVAAVEAGSLSRRELRRTQRPE